MTAAPAPSTSTVKIEKPGFYTKIKDGRLWVFREGSKELETFLANGDYPLQVVRPGAGPNGMTIKGPDAATIDAYMAAPAR
ncbi:MAG: hypothetical protein JXP34_03490 [Planctomycetes bacterium]|nr:hypothetical protein [Planctomycetota bacterium]